MDTSVPDIAFDNEDRCNYCKAAVYRMKRQLLPFKARAKALESLVDRIKTEGKGKEYDCIIGVSGGIDSTTVAYETKRLGLRPLAVHFDNGWDSELAVDNINKTLESLKIELFTYVVDWEEFKDIQLSFLKASLANCELPTDHGISALLFHVAHEHDVRYILSGSNLKTEAITPISYGAYYHQDLKHLMAVHKTYGKKPVSTLPRISVKEYLYYVFVRRIRQIPVLNYLDYDKDAYKKLLASKIGWRDYGGKHYESVWTRFFQGYYLPVKFGFDKRRSHQSTMICSGLTTRVMALKEMEKPPYPSQELLDQDMQFVLKKFGLSLDEFNGIMKLPPRTHTDFAGNYLLFHRLLWIKNIFRAIATGG
jgi:N-acetyl sugar amidotransferase